MCALLFSGYFACNSPPGVAGKVWGRVFGVDEGANFLTCAMLPLGQVW